MDIVRITHLSSPTPPAARRTRAPLTARLNAEWAGLLIDPAVADELARQPIAGFRDLAALLSACGGDRSTDLDGADIVLARVVAAGLEGRRLAVRVALQRVLGALVQIAVRRSRLEQESCPALFDELCSTAWMVIATYPLARRPRFIAANISRDCEYLTFVRPARLHQATRRVELADGHAPAVGRRGSLHDHPADELADLVRGLRGAAELAETELTLLRALASGAPITAIADALGCTDRTIRNRRLRLLSKLRELSAAA
jgi:DNA-binding CsgD family transcriptional regulator